MVTTTNRPYTPSTWQDGFLQILPDIQQRLRHGFRQLAPESREDATEDAILHCLFAYIRLYERGRATAVSPSSLAWYAILQVRRGRQAGCRMNIREPLSRYAQLGKQFRVKRLQSYSQADDTWIDMLVEDRRSSVADQVAARLDFRAWLATLSRRTRQIARALAHGFSTAEVANEHRLSAARISQLRRSLANSWAEFQGERGPG